MHIHQKEHNQILQNPVIKLYLVIVILFVVSCSKSLTSLKNKKEKDFKEIINKQINFLGSNLKNKQINIEVNLGNTFYDFIDDIKYDEKSYEYNLLYTQYSLSKENLNILFNEGQIIDYKKQSIIKKVINHGMVNNVNVKIIDSNKIPISVVNYNNSLLVLSKPFFTIKKEYAIIGYYLGNLGRDSGESGFTIYKKESEKWVLYKNILMGIS